MHTMRVWALLIVLLAATGCTRLVDEGNVPIAQVDGQKIRLRDLMTRIRQSSPQTRLRANSDEGRAAILEDLINEMVMLHEADARDITVDEAEIQAQIAEQRGQVRRARTAPGQDSLVEVAGDPELLARKLRIDKLLANHLSDAQVRARYEAMVAGPPQPTVQYDFMSVRASNPNMALDVQKALEAGTDIIQLVQTYRGHPDFVNGGRVDPVFVRLLDPWFQMELPRHGPGDVLPPYQSGRTGETTMMFVRVRQMWDHPPFEAIQPGLVAELYAEYLEELKARHTITRYPERLHLIERL